MSREDYPYEEDEFDVLGADRTPQGVHRAPVPRWRQLLPFAVVIVLAPLLAWVGVSALSGNFGGDSEETPPAATATEEQDADGEGSDDEEAGDETDGEATETDDGADENGTDEETDGPDETETDDADEEDLNLDRAVRVLVLNGTSTPGLAGSAAEVLSTEGWENTSTADYGQAQPTVTTLYYHDALVAEEAEAVADDLGIEATVESASAASQGVVIVLRDDFTLP